MVEELKYAQMLAFGEGDPGELPELADDEEDDNEEDEDEDEDEEEDEEDEGSES